MTQILAVFFSIGAVVLIAVQKENYTDVALIGVALNYSFLLPYSNTYGFFFQFVSKIYCEFSNHANPPKLSNKK